MHALYFFIQFYHRKFETQAKLLLWEIYQLLLNSTLWMWRTSYHFESFQEGFSDAHRRARLGKTSYVQKQCIHTTFITYWNIRLRRAWRKSVRDLLWNSDHMSKKYTGGPPGYFFKIWILYKKHGLQGCAKFYGCKCFLKTLKLFNIHIFSCSK